MTLKARVARLEGSQGEMPGGFKPRRHITCHVRLHSVEEDTRIAFAAAGLEISDGDIIRQIICEWPGQPHPVDPAFVPNVTDVEPIPCPAKG